jgi:hypothetical protein
LGDAALFLAVVFFFAVGFLPADAFLAGLMGAAR